MSTDRPKRDVSTALIGWVVVGLMLYALSFGPACWIVETAALDRSVWVYKSLRAFYAPLHDVASLTQTGRDILVWYVSLFVRLG